MNQSNNSPNKNNLLDPPRINILNTSVTSEHENMEASYMDLSGSKANSTAKKDKKSKKNKLYDILNLPLNQRSLAHGQQIYEFIQNFPMVKSFITGGDNDTMHQTLQMCKNMQLRQFKKGQVLMHQNEKSNNMLFIIMKGKVVILQESQAHTVFKQPAIQKKQKKKNKTRESIKISNYLDIQNQVNNKGGNTVMNKRIQDMSQSFNIKNNSASPINRFKKKSIIIRNLQKMAMNTQNSPSHTQKSMSQILSPFTMPHSKSLNIIQSPANFSQYAHNQEQTFNYENNSNSNRSNDNVMNSPVGSFRSIEGRTPKMNTPSSRFSVPCLQLIKKRSIFNTQQSPQKRAYQNEDMEEIASENESDVQQKNNKKSTQQQQNQNLKQQLKTNNSNSSILDNNSSHDEQDFEYYEDTLPTSQRKYPYTYIDNDPKRAKQWVNHLLSENDETLKQFKKEATLRQITQQINVENRLFGVNLRLLDKLLRDKYVTRVYGNEINYVETGSILGEKALTAERQDMAKRSATCYCLEDTDCMIMMRKDFLTVQKSYNKIQMQKVGIIENLLPPVKQIMNKSHRSLLINMFKYDTIERGKHLIREGEVGDKIFILLEGKLQLDKKFIDPVTEDDSKHIPIISIEQPTFFGEEIIYQTDQNESFDNQDQQDQNQKNPLQNSTMQQSLDQEEREEQEIQKQMKSFQYQYTVTTVQKSCVLYINSYDFIYKFPGDILPYIKEIFQEKVTPPPPLLNLFLLYQEKYRQQIFKSRVEKLTKNYDVKRKQQEFFNLENQDIYAQIKKPVIQSHKRQLLNQWDYSQNQQISDHYLRCQNDPEEEAGTENPESGNQHHPSMKKSKTPGQFEYDFSKHAQNLNHDNEYKKFVLKFYSEKYKFLLLKKKFSSVEEEELFKKAQKNQKLYVKAKYDSSFLQDIPLEKLRIDDQGIHFQQHSNNVVLPQQLSQQQQHFQMIQQQQQQNQSSGNLDFQIWKYSQIKSQKYQGNHLSDQFYSEVKVVKQPDQFEYRVHPNVSNQKATSNMTKVPKLYDFGKDKQTDKRYFSRMICHGQFTPNLPDYLKQSIEVVQNTNQKQEETKPDFMKTLSQIMQNSSQKQQRNKSNHIPFKGNQSNSNINKNEQDFQTLQSKTSINFSPQPKQQQQFQSLYSQTTQENSNSQKNIDTKTKYYYSYQSPKISQIRQRKDTEKSRQNISQTSHSHKRPLKNQKNNSVSIQSQSQQGIQKSPKIHIQSFQTINTENSINLENTINNNTNMNNNNNNNNVMIRSQQNFGSFIPEEREEDKIFKNKELKKSILIKSNQQISIKKQQQQQQTQENTYNSSTSLNFRPNTVGTTQIFFENSFDNPSKNDIIHSTSLHQNMLQRHKMRKGNQKGRQQSDILAQKSPQNGDSNDHYIDYYYKQKIIQEMTSPHGNIPQNPYEERHGSPKIIMSATQSNFKNFHQKKQPKSGKKSQKIFNIQTLNEMLNEVKPNMSQKLKEAQIKRKKLYPSKQQQLSQSQIFQQGDMHTASVNSTSMPQTRKSSFISKNQSTAQATTQTSTATNFYSNNNMSNGKKPSKFASISSRKSLGKRGSLNYQRSQKQTFAYSQKYQKWEDQNSQQQQIGESAFQTPLEGTQIMQPMSKSYNFNNIGNNVQVQKEQCNQVFQLEK